MTAKGRHTIEARLARIEGHIHAVHRMAHDGKSYPEIVHQIAAVRSSLDSVLQAIVDELADNCVHPAASRASVTSAVEELRTVVASAL
ncbi:MAG TPA: metal-sensitive transcriptional regulator [Thermoplasmata archaeon]|nr:metal-sensitive transcriptional regulator [Thermoplasmata archaeon]